MRLNKRLYNNTFTLRPYTLGAVVVGGALIQFCFVFVALQCGGRGEGGEQERASHEELILSMVFIPQKNVV